jgi:RNA chaperone Hfq
LICGAATQREDGRYEQTCGVSGKRLTGIIRRFDRYSIALENHGAEQLVYKHAVASIAPVSGFPEKQLEDTEA